MRSDKGSGMDSDIHCCFRTVACSDKAFGGHIRKAAVPGQAVGYRFRWLGQMPAAVLAVPD